MQGFTDVVSYLNSELENSKIIIRRAMVDVINLNIIKIDEGDLPRHCREQFSDIKGYMVDALEALKYASHSIALLNSYYNPKG